MESLKDVVISLISSLDASLHKKSRRQHQQQQQGLQWLFMASNAHHVLKQAESSETMRLLLGHGWILERREQLDGHIARYLAASWEPLLSCFQEAADDDDGDHHAGTSRIPLICFGARATSSSPSPAAAARTMITRFNVEFEETWSIHRAWKVEDGQLRDRMRRAVAGTIVPAYREFLEKRRRRVLPEFVRFSAEEMEERLSELYEG
ncbi:exocyst complex component EXO70A1-like [Oryza brachyantha]|uniref:exocyst complex component EXO70A1-like n=1 Tax=Oryza brachyantha TaxID=4533 RepID=UPI001AD9AC4E|nr:exocyst complex component EXO70A1-like [Oryza brachyantha]